MLCYTKITSINNPPSLLKKTLKSSHQCISEETLPIGPLCDILKIFGTEDKRNQGVFPSPRPLRVYENSVYRKKRKEKKVTNTQTFVFPYHLELAGLWTSYCHFDSCMSHWVSCLPPEALPHDSVQRTEPTGASGVRSECVSGGGCGGNALAWGLIDTFDVA